MYYVGASISNYKSLVKPHELRFGDGFNVVFGRNNSGKTAVLEAISLSFTNNPHRSTKTVKPNRPLGVSCVEIEFAASNDEVWEVLQGLDRVHISLPGIGPGGLKSHHPEVLLPYCQAVLDRLEFRFRLRFAPPDRFTIARLPSYGGYLAQRGDDDASFAMCTVDPVKRSVVTATLTREPIYREFGIEIARAFSARVYFFQAERRIGQSNTTSGSEVLAGNAANLATVLNALQANPSRFDRLRKLVGDILPEITTVSVRSVGLNHEILAWFDDPAMEREDLAVPLSEVGTGTGQVLAILFLLVTSAHGRVILIDEPQSFLHPGAVRKLFEIAHAFPKHQFIITTHSPPVISSAEPSTLHHVQLVGRETHFEEVDIGQSEDLRELLADVGSSFADVFGAERILWVEGQTEERCFPAILAAFGTSLLGTAIIGVIAPSDFDRRADIVIELYARVTAAALLPPAIAFVFDSENRSKVRKDDLIRRGQGKVRFLPRPMYENYLLIPEAIASVMNASDVARPAPIGAAEIRAWLAAKWESFRLAEGNDVVDAVNGAKLLASAFAALTETRVEYRKVHHGRQLTEWILANAKHELQGLADFLVQVLRGG